MPKPTKITLANLQEWKRARRKFAVLTCYDFTTAQFMEEVGLEVVLVGDTYGEVCLGHSSTLPVRLDHLLVVTEAVRRGAPQAYLIGDMPYLSYQVCVTEAVRNAGRFMAEAGCDAVKVEVDRRLLGTVEALAAATIPVIAHLGLRPQSVHSTSGYRAQARSAEEALRLIEDARLMVQAGAVGLLLEAVPDEVSGIVAERCPVPVIGCVAGPQCDGTVVVLHDMLGYGSGHPPRSVKQYCDLHRVLTDAFRAYADDVHSGRFPADEQGIKMNDGEAKKLRALLGSMKNEPTLR